MNDCYNDADWATACAMDWLYDSSLHQYYVWRRNTVTGACISGQQGVIWQPDNFTEAEAQVDPAAPKTSPVPLPVTDLEVYEEFGPLMSPSELDDLLTDPVTGLPRSDIQPFTDAATDATDDWNAENDSDPNTNPDIDEETGDTGTETETTEEPEQDEDYCRDNPDILACSTLGDAPTAEQLTTDTIGFTVTPYSLAGGVGSCPAPSSVAFLGQVIEVPYDFICDFAVALKPIILALALLTSIFIVSGTVRADS